MKNMDHLVRQFFEGMRNWLNKVIPQQTKNCLRTTLGTIIAGESDNEAVRVGLIGSSSNGTEDLRNIKINVDWKANDVVIVAYTDNNLTNAFVLFNLNVHK